MGSWSHDPILGQKSRPLWHIMYTGNMYNNSIIPLVRERDGAAAPVTLAEGAGTNQFLAVRVDAPLSA